MTYPMAGRSPKANSLSRKGKLPKTLTRDEARRLLAAPNLRCPTGLRNRCMLELMYRAGLRVGEVVKLRPRDVYVDRGTVRVLDGNGGDGTAYFDAESLRLLLERWQDVRWTLPACGAGGPQPWPRSSARSRAGRSPSGTSSR